MSKGCLLVGGVGNAWVADETVLRIDEVKDVWFWDIIDDSENRNC